MKMTLVRRDSEALEDARKEVLRGLLDMTTNDPIYYCSGRVAAGARRGRYGVILGTDVERLMVPYLRIGLVQRVNVGYSSVSRKFHTTGYRANLRREVEIKKILDESVES